MRVHKIILFSGVVLLGLGGAVPSFASLVASRHDPHFQAFISLAGDVRLLLLGLGLLVGISAFFYHYRLVRVAYAKVFAPLFMIVISTGIALAATELTLHYKYRDVQVGGRNSPSGWTFYPTYYKYNSWGFRDVERKIAKPTDTFRILVLGDSFTFGAGVKFKEQLYTALLEQKLNSASADRGSIEVINTGLKGFSTKQQLAYLRDRGLALNPNLVVVGHVLNDAETDKLKQKFEFEAMKTSLLPARHHRALNAYSFTYFLARLSIIGLISNARSSGDGFIGYDAFLDSLYQPENLVEYERIVADLAAICAANNIPLVLVSFPRLKYTRDDSYAFAHVTDIVRGIALWNQFGFIDLRPAIRNAEAGALTVSAWDHHPNEVVHSIAANEIYKYLVAAELIPGLAMQ